MVDVLGDLKTKPTYYDLQNLKYMERCIKESLRLYLPQCALYVEDVRARFEA